MNSVIIDQTSDVITVRDAWGALLPDFVQRVIESLALSDSAALETLTRDLHAADMADLLAVLAQEQRVALISKLGSNFDVEALSELGESVRDEIVEALPNEQLASAVHELDTDDAVYLIEDLDRKDQDEILAQVSTEDRAALSRALHFAEATAGRLMQTEFVAVLEGTSVASAMDHVRGLTDAPDDFVELYVIGKGGHLMGAVPLARLLRADRMTKIDAIMEKEQTIFSVNDTEESVAYKFEHYNLFSAAVTDRAGKLVGMLTIDDVLDVIKQKADDDMLHLGGVGAEEGISGSVFATTKSRFAWLLINLLTAILASWVISWFDATIEQMVALAVLMPIVASMGGNAGTQTMTVAVRALATRQLGPVNAVKVALRETSVGLINGVLFAIIIGLFAWAWFGSNQLGFVIAAAMVINMVAAAMAGILVPLAIDHFDLDPAIASGVFVTTVTDVVGFFSFLGLAAVWL
jgi:magnesium transporter